MRPCLSALATGREPRTPRIRREPIAAEADRVREAARGSLDKRRAWKQTRNKKTSARGGGKAAELDNQVDRLVSAIYGNVQCFVRALDEDDDEVLKAKELLNELFPVGASDITSLSFEEQAAAVQHLLQDLEGRFQGHVAALGLAPLVERLSVVHAAFADALGHASPGGVTFDVVAGANGLGALLLAFKPEE